MSTFLGPKAVDILRMADAASDHDRYVELQVRATERWKSKPIDRKCDELVDRGYLARDTSRFHAFILTPKGQRALLEHVGDPAARPLVLSQAALLTIGHEAGMHYPEEACGVILERVLEPRAGAYPPGFEFLHVFPCENVQGKLHEANPKLFPKTAQHAYAIGPHDLQGIKAMEAEGWRMVVIYHSHVETLPIFSRDDARKATLRGRPLFPGVDYLVLGLSQQEPAPEGMNSAAAYRWSDIAEDFLPVKLEIAAPAPEGAESVAA